MSVFTRYFYKFYIYYLNNIQCINPPLGGMGGKRNGNRKLDEFLILFIFTKSFTSYLIYTHKYFEKTFSISNFAPRLKTELLIMIIVPLKEGENIERALKKFKRKFEKTGVIRELRSRQAFIKPSVRRREEIKKAMYVQKMQESEE